jgi:hypothetical protein
MKDYPSIARATGQNFREIPNAHIFDKLDGSSMRSEWNRKQGWYKHGRRRGLLDDSNPHLSKVPDIFHETIAPDITKIARDSGWEHLIIFYEFWGAQSVAGLHVEGDPKFLTLFDACVDKKGFLGPVDFRRTFEDKLICPTARCLGQVNWTRGYVDLVRQGVIEGITFEGVVAKAGTKHDIVRAKAKTQAWIDKVIEVHGEVAGRKLVES